MRICTLVVFSLTEGYRNFFFIKHILPLNTSHPLNANLSKLTINSFSTRPINPPSQSTLSPPYQPTDHFHIHKNTNNSIVQSSHRYGFTALLTNQYRNDYPLNTTMVEETVLLPPLLKELPSIQAEFKRKMGNPLAPDGTRRAVVVMVANEGVMDLVLNYICSAEDSGIDLKSIMVFVGSERDVKLIENMGAQALYNTALGSMPAKAAVAYLDKTFSRMMWFKVTSIFLGKHRYHNTKQNETKLIPCNNLTLPFSPTSRFLATSCGFDALFQDVDLVWTQNPIPYLRSLDADISFMDDGARTPRYTPFFVNSGFYFVKYNERTLYFQEKMMKTSACEIGRTHSHQSVLIRHISESHHLGDITYPNPLDILAHGI